MNTPSTGPVAALGMPRLSLLSELYEKVVEKITWYNTVLVLRTTKNVISQRQFKIPKRSIAPLSPHFKGFPHASTC